MKFLITTRSFPRVATLPRRSAQSLLLSLLFACGHPPATAPAPSFSATAEEVKVLSAEGQSSLQFQVMSVAEDAPLPPPAVTGRVTTVETLTSPSFAPLSGRIVSVNVRLGARVAQGDRLIEVRTAKLSTLQHDLRASQLAIKTRQAVVERLQQLVAVRVSAQSELTVAQSELEEAKLAAITAADRIKGLSVEKAGPTTYWVTASRAGTVVQLDAAPGQRVAPDSDRPLATVADLDQLVVLADVPQHDAGRIEPAQAAQILSTDLGEREIGGVVETVSEVVDPERQTVPIRVRVDNRTRALRPNSFVNVLFAPGNDRKVVIVPSSAVVSDGARSVVFVQVTAGTFRRRQVTLGRQARDRVEIIAGLRPAESVVTSGALLLLNALDVEG